MNYRVFISYRRNGQPEVAAWLHERLAAELPADEVFLDTEEIKEGTPFPLHLKLAVESAPAFIALIDANWNPIVDGGKRRLDNPQDYVRCEVELALEKAATDARRLVLPVLLDGAMMPLWDNVPDSLRPLLQYSAALVQKVGGYRQGVERVIATVLERLNDSDETPEVEKWILTRIAGSLQDLDRAQIARMGSELCREFSLSTPPPKSVRAVARTIYGIGPASLECLLALGESGQRIGRLIKLLATHWIKADVARSLRAGLQNHEARQPIAIACEYSEFTPDETLLKASHVPWGWPSVVVKPADPAREIVLQVHEKLAHYFTTFTAGKTQMPSMTSGSDDDRLRIERDAINKLLLECQTRAGRELPLVLFSDHGMALDPKVFAELYQAFPSLRILVATSAAHELRDKIPSMIVLMPADTAADEKAAYDAFENAKDLLEFTMERMK